MRSSGPSTNRLPLRVIERSAEEMPGTLLDQNVYFAPGLLDDENETYLRTILLCHPAAPKIAYAFQPTPFRNFACAVAYWATAGLGSRSSASHSLKGYAVTATKDHWPDSPNENMGLLTYGTYDAWVLCRQMKLVITFLNETSYAKIQNPV